MALAKKSVKLIARKTHIISCLQREILVLQGFKATAPGSADIGLGSINNAFPNGSFPVGAVHEFLSSEAVGATCGFMAGLLASMMGSNGVSLWISSGRQLFPPALRYFGIQPDKFIFIDLQKERHVMWAMEEALKCPALIAVVGEIPEISFTASRRLQLAVEESKVTGFILRNNPRTLSASACISRWKITPLLSHTVDNLPGIGFPQWKVELLRIRNGRPGVWEVMWTGGRFLTKRWVGAGEHAPVLKSTGDKSPPAKDTMSFRTLHTQDQAGSAMPSKEVIAAPDQKAG